MPSAVSVPVPSTAFTLTFGGVDFRLDQQDSTSGSQVSFQSSEDGVVVNLQGFTGTLRVSSSSLPAMTSEQPATAKVEEEPASPDAATTAGKGVSPKQQQLPFTKAQHKVKKTLETKTPDVAFGSTIPEKPKKGKDSSKNKRSILEIRPVPVPSPLKKNRASESSNSMFQNESQLSQTEPTSTFEADTIIPDHGLSQYAIDCSQSSVNPSESGQDEKHLNFSDKEQNTVIQMEESQEEEYLKLSPNVTSFLQGERMVHPPPCSRWGHSMTMLEGNRVLVYGGQSFDADSGLPTILSDIHVYDVPKRLWYKPVNCEGVPRQWHTATYLPERQLLISFGGETTHPKTGRITTTDEVMVLDTEIMLWYPPSVIGTIPSGRSGHSASFLPDTNELVVFGGVKGSKWLNSLSVLDTGRWKWSVPKISSGDAPRPRSYHSATPVRGANGKSQLVIFGGNDRAKSFNTVHVLESDGTTFAWINPKVSGSVPLARTGHCATLLSDHKTILIYGGWDPNAEDETNDEDMVFGDSYLLNTETWEWRVGPKAAFAGDGQSVSHSLVQDGGEKRVGHKSVLVQGEGSAEVLVFGGRVPKDKFANDFQTLKVTSGIHG